jgi:hypothetical protein
VNKLKMRVEREKGCSDAVARKRVSLDHVVDHAVVQKYCTCAESTHSELLETESADYKFIDSLLWGSCTGRKHIRRPG